jgi:hypothetical protein
LKEISEQENISLIPSIGLNLVEQVSNVLVELLSILHVQSNALVEPIYVLLI